MDKMVYLYSRYLSEICHCYADENGNRPCDNGAICDRCEQQEISFNDWRENRRLGQEGINIEFKDVYYLIEWWGITSWGERFTNSEWFKDENEAESFIAYDLANDPLVRGATFTTHKTIKFNRGK